MAANTITVNDTEYNVDDLNDHQRTIVNHLADLDRKIGSAQFNMDQLQVGRGAFVQMLNESLADLTDG